jgi:mannose-6-phosphate isomerase-like protein (cupin superfamily)
MPKTSKQDATETLEAEGYEGHLQELGGYTVAFETYTEDADLASLFAGLPDDRCQSVHLGYVLSGSVKFTFTDGHEEVYVAGDAYHVPPGHTPTIYAGTEVVEFSPTEALQQTLEVVNRNLEAASATSG